MTDIYHDNRPARRYYYRSLPRALVAAVRPYHTWTLTKAIKSLLQTATLQHPATLLQELRQLYPDDVQLQDVFRSAFYRCSMHYELTHRLTIVWIKSPQSQTAGPRCLECYWQIYCRSIPVHRMRARLPVSPAAFQQASRMLSQQASEIADSPALWLTTLRQGYSVARSIVTSMEETP